MPVDSDIIKIKGREDTWTCIFFKESNQECSIYNNRPRQCRSLKCWDTRELEKMYARRRLTREDLISEVEGLWDLIKDHQERCDYAKIQGLISDLDSRHRVDAQRRLAQIIRYDMEIRELAVSRGAMDPDMLDFLFGRPLTKTLPNYGVKVRQQGMKITLVAGCSMVDAQSDVTHKVEK